MASSTASDVVPTVSAPPGSGRAAPFALVVGLLTGMLLVTLAHLPIQDIDLYWHILAGREIVEGSTVRGIGAEWPFTDVANDWTTTQWLSEIWLAGLDRWADWAAMAAFVIVSTALAVAILGRYTVASEPVVISGWPFLTATAATIIAADARPQQFTLIGAALMGGVLRRGLVSSLLPRWWVLLPSVWVWANLHGGWVLAPVVLGLIGVRGLLAEGLSSRLLRAAAGRAMAAVAVGAIAPSGLANVTAVFRFADAAGQIREWQKVVLISPGGLLVLVMVGIIVISWLRTAPVPFAELLSSTVIVVFALTAYRNIAPALLLLAPLVSHRLMQAFPVAATRKEPRWSTWGGVGMAAALACVAIPLAIANSDSRERELPVELARAIGERGQPERVLNEYNLAGIVLYFGGADARVAIDGRTDFYGAEYIERYLGLLRLEGDFESELDRLSPTIALLRGDGPMAWFLEEHRGWRVVGTDGDWTLLAPVAPART